MNKLLLCCLLSLPLMLMSQQGAFLGVHSNHVSKKKAKVLGFENRYGNYITNVIPKTSADKAGLKPFDYITGFNDVPFTKDDNMTDRLHELNPKEKIQINFTRNGKARSRKVAIGARGDGERRKRTRAEDPFLGVSALHEKLPKGVNGVPVGVIECTTASAMGLMSSDVITAIDKIPMYDWHDLGAAIDNREVGDKIEVEYYRNGKLEKLKRPILSLAASKKCEEEQEEVEDMDVDMENVTQTEADGMKEEKGIEMPLVNNLEIERLNVFPNPTNGLFELRFNLPAEGNTSIRIFNAGGAEIYRTELGRFTGDFRDRIDIGSQMKGSYFIMIQQGKRSISKKLILQ
ncbi:MAG: PDZ domain-containing protein [Saprospiraceae bacterium]|nr:PDZ domain-containing protein [Saprospiraceae bacterium]